jgi:hypothetical protein
MPQLEHSPEDIQILIDYARQRFEEERWPLSPALRPVREALDRMFPKPEPTPLPPAKPYEPSWATRKKRIRR